MQSQGGPIVWSRRGLSVDDSVTLALLAAARRRLSSLLRPSLTLSHHSFPSQLAGRQTHWHPTVGHSFKVPMAAQQQNYFQHPSSFYPPSHPHEQPFTGIEDTKAPYDDLIDQYAIPFSQNPKHKSVTVDPSAFNSSERSLPYNPSHKQATSDVTSKDLEGTSSQGHDWGYPPPSVPPPIEKEKLNWLSMVRVILPLYLLNHVQWFLPQVVPDSIACRLYVLVVLIETAIDLAIEADLFLRFQDNDPSDESFAAHNKMPVYLAVFCLAQYAFNLPSFWAFFFTSPIQRVPIRDGGRCRLRTKYSPIHFPHVSSPTGIREFLS